MQSLEAIDRWIDVINANINGGVRTAFKSSRLKFSGSTVQMDRPPTATNLPLQFPEATLVTANTVIDFSQGAITSSTEITHLALQGPGFFKLRRLADDPTDANTKFFYSRDGEFHWMALSGGEQLGTPGMIYAVDPNNPRVVLVNTQGLAVVSTNGELVSYHPKYYSVLSYVTAWLDNETYLDEVMTVKISNPQELEFSQYGSTIFRMPSSGLTETQTSSTETTLLSKALEASNSSMTQSVPELSLAQKLFSALTKVMQTYLTNVDATLNTIR